MFHFLKTLSVMMFVAVALSAEAKYKAPPFPEVFTYNQLMTLPPYKRIEYMKGLRAMLVELSQMSKQGRGSLVSDAGDIETLMNPDGVEKSEESYNALLKLIDILLPRAYADSCPNGGISFGNMCAHRCELRDPKPGVEQGIAVGNKYYCFNKTELQNFTRAGGTAARLEEMRLESASQAAAEAAIQQRETQMKQDEQIATNAQNRITRQAEEQAAKDRGAMLDQQEAMKKFEVEQEQKRVAKLNDQREALKADPTYNEKFLNRPSDPSGEQRFTSIMDGKKKDDAEVREQYEKAKIELAGLQQEKDLYDADQANRAGQAQDQAAKNELAQLQQERELGEAEVAARGEKEIDRQMAENHKQSNSHLAGKDDAGAPSMAPASVEEKMRSKEENEICKKTLLTCEEKSIKKYKSEKGKTLGSFRAKKEDSCISSGNMSSYKDGDIKPNNCKPVNVFCYNPEDERCTEPGKYKAGESRQAREKANPGEPTGIGHAKIFSCEKGRLCNPLVFGAYVKTGKGLCVPSGSADLTVNCEKAVRDIERKDPKGTTFTKDILKEGGAGVANAWDDWRDKFNKACKGGSESQLAHCEECTIIASRLMKLSRMATGSCDYGLNYNQLSKQKPTAGDTEAER